MKPVEILTIKNKIPLFKGEEEANAIELIQLEEVGFEIVAQKGLYEIGQKAIYIQPDYSLSNIPLFESFIQPGGDPKKSRLGLNNRIRAIKFNLHIGDGQPVYSVGILLPYYEVQKVIVKGFGSMNLENYNLTEVLNITKWEAPEPNSGGINVGASTGWRSDMYHTDEENINNLWNKIQYPINLIGTEKCDGSSISLWFKDGRSGICSRNQGKPLKYNKIVGYKKLPWWGKLINWVVDYKPDLCIKEEVDNNTDDFVKIGKPYLEKLENYCLTNNLNLVLRGELNGQGLKGSGNKNNPDIKNTPNIKFFGLDNYDGFTVKEGESYFQFTLDKLGDNFIRCKKVFSKTFNSKEEIIEECNNYFKDNMIEGIVLRDYGSKFSAKFMNLEYDSKK